MVEEHIKWFDARVPMHGILRHQDQDFRKELYDVAKKDPQLTKRLTQIGATLRTLSAHPEYKNKLAKMQKSASQKKSPEEKIATFERHITRWADEIAPIQTKPATTSIASKSANQIPSNHAPPAKTGLAFQDEPTDKVTKPLSQRQNAKFILLGIDGAHKGRAFPVTKNGVTIGSANANEVVMPRGIGVNAKHAVIKPGLLNAQINLTKDSVVHVDGEEHAMNFLKRGLSKAKLGTVKLPLGSGIAFGPDGTEHEMLLLPASPQANLSPNNWSLFAIDGPHKGTKFNLNFGDNIIGVDKNSDVKLSKGAKAQHAKITIEKDEDGDVILNLNKLQGKVNSTQIIEDEIYHDQPVEQQEQINAGYKIEIGKHKFVLLPPSKQTTPNSKAAKPRAEQTNSNNQTSTGNQSTPQSGGKLKKFTKAALLAGAIAGLGAGGVAAYKNRYELGLVDRPAAYTPKKTPVQEEKNSSVGAALRDFNLDIESELKDIPTKDRYRIARLVADEMESKLNNQPILTPGEYFRARIEDNQMRLTYGSDLKSTSVPLTEKQANALAEMLQKIKQNALEKAKKQK